MARCHCPHDRVSYHISLAQEQPNSKFQVQFLVNAYHFHSIIKSKYLKSNHCKSGSIYNSITIKQYSYFNIFPLSYLCSRPLRTILPNTPSSQLKASTLPFRVPGFNIQATTEMDQGLFVSCTLTSRKNVGGQ